MSDNSTELTDQQLSAGQLQEQLGGGLNPETEDLLEDAVAFAGVSRFPARVKCALLSWMAWKDATAQALSAAAPAEGK